MTRHYLLVGSTKGLFIYQSNDRSDWVLSGPHLKGWEIFSAFMRADGRILVGTSHFVYGPCIRYSDDFGASWDFADTAPKYPKSRGYEVKRIWQLQEHQGKLYAGVDSAGLFESSDQGNTWREVEALSQHPTREQWFPGQGGLCLHTIIPDHSDSQNMWVGISAAGVFRSRDSGQSWQVQNHGLPEIPTKHMPSEVGRCVHKMVQDPLEPQRLYMQYHGTVYTSYDAGDSWQEWSEGLPCRFGFPMSISSQGEVFVIPLESDEYRMVPDGRLRVYKRQAQDPMWREASTGLPQRGQHIGVLRDSLCCDDEALAGVYFGTSSGSVYASKDAGRHWRQLEGNVPRVTCVSTRAIHS